MRARLDDARDGYYLALFADREIDDHVHHLMDHRVELVLRDADAIEAAGEIHVLIAAQDINLADKAPRVEVRHPA